MQWHQKRCTWYCNSKVTTFIWLWHRFGNLDGAEPTCLLFLEHENLLCAAVFSYQNVFGGHFIYTFENDELWFRRMEVYPDHHMPLKSSLWNSKLNMTQSLSSWLFLNCAKEIWMQFLEMISLLQRDWKVLVKFCCQLENENKDRELFQAPSDCEHRSLHYFLHSPQRMKKARWQRETSMRQSPWFVGWHPFWSQKNFRLTE